MPNTPQNWQRLQNDPTFRARMERRSRILAEIRAFFRGQDFLEVETPTVVRVPGMEPHLDPFQTRVNRSAGGGNSAAEFGAHLITSPEYAMKKLLAGGLPRIFEITRCYRNGEPWDGTHNHEFTMIEWYRADADYTALMRDTEEMVAQVALRTTGDTTVRYQGRDIDLLPEWPRMTVAEAMERYAGIDLGAGIDDPERFRADVEAKHCATQPSDTFDDVFFRIFLRDVEPKLGMNERGRLRPLILYEYPASMAALARLKPSDHRFAERFEAYVGGMELANAFSELNDPAEQRRRLVEEQEMRAKLGHHLYGLDDDFLEAVGKMPPAAGIALGIDRLVMLLADAASIREVLFFPASDLFKDCV